MSPERVLVGGRYRLDERIAVGGMGEVWRAEDTVLNRTVAVKLLKGEYAGDDAFRQRFLSEARHAAVLDHPGVAQVYDFGDHADPDDPVGAGHRPFLVMELVRGTPLSDHIGRGRFLPPVEAARVVALAADALQAAHERQIVHRDVKPANLMLTESGAVKVTDFGIAKAAGAVSVTVTGMVIGTPHYLSPEQASGKEVTPASDVYSLGVVLYEALAGVRPFDRDSQVATALAHVRDEPPPLPDRVPAGLRDITRRAMAKDPLERPASAEQLAHELRYGPSGAGGAAAGLAATSVLPHPPTPPTLPTTEVPPPAARPWWRRPALVVAAVAVLVLMGVGIAFALQGGDGAESAAQDQAAGSGTQDSPPASSPDPELSTPEPSTPAEQTTTEPATVAVVPEAYLGREAADVQAELEELGLVVETVDLDDEAVAADPDLNALAASIDPASVTSAVLALEPTGELEAGSTVTVSVYPVPDDLGNEGTGNEGTGNEGTGNGGTGNDGTGQGSGQGSGQGNGEGEGDD